MHVWIRCISIPAVTATYGFALTASHLEKPVGAAGRRSIAPTGERAHLKPGRLSGRLALLLIVAPR
ncbi:hypothetical protein EMIT0P218_80015 [Pseudomonas sp. IT-P218]